jgi:hypothetical protein
MLVMLVAAALVPAGPACHPNRIWAMAANLDGDAVKEQVRAIDSHDCQHEHFSARVTIRDRCEGVWTTFQVADERLPLRSFRVVDVDGWTKRRELFFVIGDTARIVRLAARRGKCPRPRDLFSVSGASSVELADLTRRYRGLELRVVASGETTFFRYSRTQRRYVRYAA